MQESDASQEKGSSAVSDSTQIYRAFVQASQNRLGLQDLLSITEQWTSSNPSLAIALYGVWLSQNASPVSGGAWFNLGILFRNLGNDDQAETAFRNALANMPSLDHARFELASVLERTGRIGEAWNYCKTIIGPPGQILKVANGSADVKVLYSSALYLGGRLLEARGLLGSAENMLEQCLILAGMQPDVAARYRSLQQSRRLRDPDRSPETNGRSLACVHFDIVGGCQLKCVGCPEAINARKITMIEPDLLRQCLANLDVDSIGMLRLFNFGEPLLHKRLVEVMKVVDEFRSGHVRVGRVEITTNGQGGQITQLEQALKNGSIDLLAVSCDGNGTKEQYEELRPPSRWEKFLWFLDTVANIRDKHNLDVFLQTRTVVASKEDEERWKALLLPRGWTPEFRPRYILPEAPENRAGRPLQPGKGRCSHLSGPSLFVDVDGTVVPCCAHPRAGIFGNLATTKYSEIAAGRPRATFIEMMDSRRSEMFACKDCEL